MNDLILVLGTLGAWNLAVFLTYGVDKWKAVRKAYRIPERTLMWQSILLGGLGAFLGGQVFRHKIRKWYFWLAWLAGLALDLALIYLIWSKK